MRKAVSGVLATVILLSSAATTAYAAGPGSGRCFADVDGDGICDNAGSMCIYVDADGDGVCDNYMTGLGRGYGRGSAFLSGGGGNFVDADGDGVCDNYVSGQGGGYGRGFRGGCGNGFRGGRSR